MMTFNKFTITTIGNSTVNNRLEQLLVIYEDNCTKILNPI